MACSCGRACRSQRRSGLFTRESDARPMREAGSPSESQAGPTRVVGFAPAQPQPRACIGGSSRAAESPLSRMLREGCGTPPYIRGVLGRADSSEMSEDGNESSGSRERTERQSYDEAFGGANEQRLQTHGASLPVEIPGAESRRRAGPGPSFHCRRCCPGEPEGARRPHFACRLLLRNRIKCPCASWGRHVGSPQLARAVDGLGSQKVLHADGARSHPHFPLRPYQLQPPGRERVNWL